MKGIIVVDIPECCGDCDSYNWKKHECKIVGSGDCKAGERRQENCPIKPMPVKIEESVHIPPLENRKIEDIVNILFKASEATQHAKGWNDCVETILKGAENGQEQTRDR